MSQSFPEVGQSRAALEAELTRMKAGDFDWTSGRVAAYTYYRDAELLDLSKAAYLAFFQENLLGTRVFPSLVQIERDVIQMGRELFHAPHGDGLFTSGGTESIFLACLAARERAFAQGFERSLRPQIVCCETLHGAFNKAALFLGMEVLRTPMRADFRADPALIESALSERTVMVAASAPSYAHGVFDPIEPIAALASARGLWFHVDACVGGFLAPFLADAGYPAPRFDFLVPGVTSLSADIHKYGMAAKGASLLVFGGATDREHTSFVFSEWPKGTYTTATFGGSRPAGPLASAWAVMKYLGRAGYAANLRTIMDTRARLAAGIQAIDGLEVLPGDLCMLAYRGLGKRLDTDALAEQMGQRGWYVGRNARPKSIHLALNTVHARIVEPYLADLRSAVDAVRASGLVGKEDTQTY
ncbi:MAG TPA: aminotransferase class V-fold PLP-dependent enzyme [Burkholderiaceae bacterium]